LFFFVSQFFKQSTIEAVIQEGISNTQQILTNEASYSAEAVVTEAIDGILCDWNRDATDSNREYAKEKMLNRISIYKKLKNFKMWFSYLSYASF